MGKAKPVYCYDDAELKTVLAGAAQGSYTLQRFKVRCSQIPMPISQDVSAYNDDYQMRVGAACHRVWVR